MAGGPIAAGGGLSTDGPKNKWAGILMTLFAAFGGILYGYDTGTISGIIAMQNWKCTFGHTVNGVPCTITTSNTALVVSILSVGTFFGALLGAPMADIVGRRMGIIASCLVFCIGVAMQTASTALPLFVVGRVFAGLGVGLVSCLIPMYQSECAPKWIRGGIVSCYQFAITIGILLANVFNNATQGRNDHSSYRIPIGIQFIWAFVLAAGMVFLPESPRFLIKRGRDEAAAKSLSRLLGTSDVNDSAVQFELNEIRSALQLEQEMAAGSYLDCFRDGGNKVHMRTLTAIFLQAWQQLTGINFIFYYGTTFFQSSGIASPFLISIATSVVNVGMTIPGIYLVDKAGRRNLLLWGALGMLVCEYIVAIVGVTVGQAGVTDGSRAVNLPAQKVLVAFTCIYIAFFASTWGPIAWVVTGEIFPLNVRGKGMSLATASNWLWNWALSFATPYLVQKGPGDANLGVKVFFIWGSTCVGCLIFTYFFIPETKGLALEQIDLLYQNSTPRTSIAYRNRIINENITAQDTLVRERKGHAAADERHSDEKV
ncbi:hypothetical protein M422DRAFT_23957 [Sphaerobolus stellatus SS14]|nr:hypothetical protein M422DRAFT_23957 [Sphaerobolus stellatus SS14]